MSLALSEARDELTWADLTADEKAAAVYGSLVAGRTVEQVAAHLSLIYGPIGANHVRGVMNRAELTAHPDVIAVRRERADLERAASLARARASRPDSPPRAKPLPAVPAPDLKSGCAGVTIYDLTAGRCKRPLWGADFTGGPLDKFYCGAAAPEGAAWCADCAPDLMETISDRRSRMRGRKGTHDAIRGTAGRWS